MSPDASAPPVAPADLPKLLAALAKTGDLASVELRDTAVSDAAARSLAALLRAKPSIRKVHLVRAGLSAAAAAHLADGLAVHQSFTSWMLSHSAHLGDGGLAALAPGLRRQRWLAALHLAGTGLTDRAALDVAAVVADCPALVELDLCHNALTHLAFAELADAMVAHPRTWTLLGLAYNPLMGPQGAAALAHAGVFRALAELDLTACRVGNAGAEQIAQAMRATTHGNLLRIVLCDNEIGSAGAVALADVLAQAPNCELLDLAENLVGDAGAVALASACHPHRALHTLSLSLNIVAADGAAALANALFSPATILSLVRLDRNYMDQAAQRAVVLESVRSDAQDTAQIDVGEPRARTCPHVPLAVEERFWDNRHRVAARIDDIRTRYLSRADAAPPSPRLLDVVAALQSCSFDEASQIVDLGHQLVGDAGAALLAAVLAVPGVVVRTLVLAGNDLSSAAAQDLASVLASPDSTLTHLDLSHNRLLAQGGAHLADALEDNTTLWRLDLDDTDIGVGGAQSLMAGLARNRTLQHLSLADNGIRPEAAYDIGRRAAEHAALAVLVLDSNSLGDAGLDHMLSGAQSAASADTVPPLRALSLRANNIGPESADTLPMLAQCFPLLQDLQLDDNMLGGDASFSVFQSLGQSSALSAISLRNNDIPLVVQAELRQTSRDLSIDGSFADEPRRSLSRWSSAPDQSTATATAHPGPADSHSMQQPSYRPVASPGAGATDTSTARQPSPSYSAAPPPADSYAPRQPSPSPEAHPARAAPPAHMRTPAAQKRLHEIAQIDLSIAELQQRRQGLVDQIRAEDEASDALEHRQAIAELEAAHRPAIPFPALQPLTAQEMHGERERQRAHIEQRQRLDLDISDRAKALEIVRAQQRELRAQIDADAGEISRLEAQIRELISSRDNAFLARADALDRSRKHLVDRVERTSKQHTAAIEEEAVQLGRLVDAYTAVVALEEQRKAYLQGGAAQQGSFRFIADMYEYAHVTLLKYLDLKRQGGLLEQQEDARKQAWLVAKDEVRQMFDQFQGILAREETAYQEYRGSMAETHRAWKEREQLRIRSNLGDRSVDEIEELIPIARQRYEFYQPLRSELAECEAQMRAARDHTDKHGSERDDARERVVSEREAGIAVQQALAVASELERVKTERTDAASRVTAIESQFRALTADKERARGRGDVQKFRQLDAKLAQLAVALQSAKDHLVELEKSAQSLEARHVEQKASVKGQPAVPIELRT